MKTSCWNVGGAGICPVTLILRSDFVHYLPGERISNISVAGREFFVRVLNRRHAAVPMG